MWSKFLEVKNGYIAKVWKDLYEAEGVSVRVVPPLTSAHSNSEPRQIWVPDAKTHVAAEILRKV